MRDWLGRLSGWHTVAVVGLGLAAVVALVMVLPESALTPEVVGGLIAVAGVILGAGTLPGARPPGSGSEPGGGGR